MSYSPTVAYNDLPPIPVDRLETMATLRQAIQANRALAELKAAGPLIPNERILLRAMLLQEARASSEVENVVTTTDALYQAFGQNPDSADPATREVLRYGDALWQGYDDILAGRMIQPSLMTRLVERIKGTNVGVRTGTDCKIANDVTGEVVYTPPAGSDLILRLLNDLSTFIAAEHAVDPLIVMSAAHRQFEAIHPFPDGNGRTGRVLNILYLVQAKLLRVPVLYLSRYIVQHKGEYYRLLRQVTEDDDWENWVLFMLHAVSETAAHTLHTLNCIRQAMDSAASAARQRKVPGYSLDLIHVVFSQPYTRVKHVVDAGIAQRKTAAVYLKGLENIGLLTAVPRGREVLYHNDSLLQAMLGDSA